MPKIEIEVDAILTVAVPLEEVKPGDRLLVMNGLVVGVIEGLQVGRAALVAVSQPIKPTSNVSSGNRRWTQHDAVDLIRKHGPISAYDLGKKLHANLVERSRLSVILRAARAAGQLEAVPGSGRYASYRLPAQASGAIKAAD